MISKKNSPNKVVGTPLNGTFATIKPHRIHSHNQFSGLRLWQGPREMNDVLLILFLGWIPGLQKGMERALQRPLRAVVNQCPLLYPGRG